MKPKKAQAYGLIRSYSLSEKAYWLNASAHSKYEMWKANEQITVGMIAPKFNIPSTNQSVHEHRMWKHFVETLNNFGKIVFL